MGKIQVNWELIVAPEAEDEIAKGRDWYDEQRSSLGVDFLKTVAAGLVRIKDNPLQYQLVSDVLRRLVLSRFPYSLIYTVTGELIRVVGCVHGARDPDVWQKRT